MLRDGSAVKLREPLTFWLTASSKKVVPAGTIGSLRKMKTQDCCEINGRYACDQFCEFAPGLHGWIWGVEFPSHPHPLAPRRFYGFLSLEDAATLLEAVEAAA